MPLRTGVEGYCIACSTTFGEALKNKGVDGSKDAFGIELFGHERFHGDANTRFRTWRLKGTNSGRGNRFSIFEEQWLPKECLASLKDTELEIEDAKAQTKTLNYATKGLSSLRQTATRALRTDGATNATYVSAALELATGSKGLSDKLRKMPNANTLSQEHAALIDSLCAWLDGQAAYLRDVASQQATNATLASAITQAKSDLTEKDRELKSHKATLKERKSRASNTINQTKNSLREQAVADCVQAMMADETSLLWNAMMSNEYDFANQFCGTVVPCIEEGFYAEACDRIQVESFRHQMDDWMNSLTSEQEDRKKLFGQFLTELITALIYKPSYTKVGAATTWEDEYVLGIEEPLGKQIMLTQLFTPDGRFVGKAETFGNGDVIFLGRNGIPEDYVDTCQAALPGEQSLFQDKTLKAFHISEEHGQVSNLHGVIFCEDDTWRFLDFSRYGTALVGRDVTGNEFVSHFQNAFRELEAGSVLYLGAKEEDADERLYRKAAAVKLSYFLDEDSETVNS